MVKLFTWISSLFAPKNPSYGDVRIVKEKGAYGYEIEQYRKQCYGDGDEWVEWEKVDYRISYDHALYVAQNLHKQYNKIPPKKRLIYYIRADK